MAERIELTESDLIEAILSAAALADNTDCAMTTEELVVRTGISYDSVRARLKRLAREQKLEVRHVLRPTIDGRMAGVPAYRLRGGSDGSEG